MTALAYVLGSVAAGAAVGAALGAAGSVALAGLAPSTRLVALGVVVALGLLWELNLLGLSLPTVHRQVNEEWLHAYRGWVYGLGYGLQLGLGVVTVVNSAAVYATMAAELLSAAVLPATVVGGCFGAVRGVALLAGAGIRAPGTLVELDGLLRRSEPWSGVASRSGQALVAAACVTVALVR